MQSTTSAFHFSSGAGNSAADTASDKSQVKFDSMDILQGNKSITIQHNGSLYRLQATKLGKLILTK
ncbi:Hemin uptake protein HemP [Lampropedia hyalina DSM 16112]|uniref:Hemin uptake protein HemP n=1 Tax=Lampropedia hyalina DSM 16112 TaxID=1122156 RepID=A0A1M4U3H6_9BURK|nr:hemin uptake protein HemP [Lampropedia hyalina]SHE51361.1 Hemin uptake protein HemP [Lampropedia hyalina DSM 16112]